MKIKILIAAALFSMLLTACSDEAEVTNTANTTDSNQEVNASSDEAEIANTSNTTDSNQEANATNAESKNGVRDDVAAHIKNRHIGPHYEPAMKFARSLQAMLDADTSDISKVTSLYKENAQDMVCFNKARGFMGKDEFENPFIEDIIDLTLNTDEYYDQHNNFMKAAPSSIPRPDESNCS